MKAMVALIVLGFVFWSGEIRVRTVGVHGQMKYTTEYGLFRGNTETGEVEELMRCESGRREGSHWMWLQTKEPKR